MNQIKKKITYQKGSFLDTVRLLFPWRYYIYLYPVKKTFKIVKRMDSRMQITITFSVV